MRPAIRISVGIAEVDRRLDQLARRDANRIARAGVQAGLTVITKSIRSAIDSSDASGEMKRALKATVGKRFVTGGRRARFGVSAKAGLGVAKKQSAGSKDRTGRKGVGLGANNVHWAALGTDQRFTGAKSIAQGKGRSRRLKLTGHPRKYTGAMPQIAVVRRAGTDALTTVRSIMADKCREKIAALGK